MRAQLFQIGLHLVLLDVAAHGHHIGHARHLAQRTLHHPVFEGSQFCCGLAVTAQAVAHDLAHRRGIGRDVGFHARWQVYPTQAFIDLLACDVHIGVVVVGDHGERQAELRVREHADRIGQTGQCHLDRQRDLLFHFLGGTARVQRNHRHLGVGHVRKSLDRQVLEGDHASHRKQQRAQHDEQRLVERVMDEFFHLAWPPMWAAS